MRILSPNVLARRSGNIVAPCIELGEIGLAIGNDRDAGSRMRRALEQRLEDCRQQHLAGMIGDTDLEDVRGGGRIELAEGRPTRRPKA